MQYFEAIEHKFTLNMSNKLKIKKYINFQLSKG
jgi:hypothetical protein